MLYIQKLEGLSLIHRIEILLLLILHPHYLNESNNPN